jgi:hypothetical protein
MMDRNNKKLKYNGIKSDSDNDNDKDAHSDSTKMEDIRIEFIVVLLSHLQLLNFHTSKKRFL